LDSDVDGEYNHFQRIEAFLQQTESPTPILSPAYQKFEDKQVGQMESNTGDAEVTVKAACILFASQFLPMPPESLSLLSCHIPDCINCQLVTSSIVLILLMNMQKDETTWHGDFCLNQT
jgi:hypothetical protein